MGGTRRTACLGAPGQRRAPAGHRWKAPQFGRQGQLPRLRQPRPMVTASAGMGEIPIAAECVRNAQRAVDLRGDRSMTANPYLGADLVDRRGLPRWGAKPCEHHGRRGQRHQRALDEEHCERRHPCGRLCRGRRSGTISGQPASWKPVQIVRAVLGASYCLPAGSWSPASYGW